MCVKILHKIKPHVFYIPTGFQLACNARSISLPRPRGKLVHEQYSNTDLK